jgi:hypothetical protein
MSTISTDENMTWTKSELLEALRDNRVAGVGAVGLTVKFLLKNEDRGVSSSR